MTLREYLKNCGMSIKHFSNFIGYAPPYVSNAMSGNQIPGLKFKKWVMEKTGGQVTVNEWPTK